MQTADEEKITMRYAAILRAYQRRHDIGELSRLIDGVGLRLAALSSRSSGEDVGEIARALMAFADLLHLLKDEEPGNEGTARASTGGDYEFKFVVQEMRVAFSRWVTYRRSQTRMGYNSVYKLIKEYGELFVLSSGDETAAIHIVEDCIAKGYDDFTSYRLQTREDAIDIQALMAKYDFVAERHREVFGRWLAKKIARYPSYGNPQTVKRCYEYAKDGVSFMEIKLD